MSPSNQALLRELGRDLYPPTHVCRNFRFPDGIPPEYQAFDEAGLYRHEKEHTIMQLIDIDLWRENVNQEQRLADGHALRGHDYEEPL